VNKLQVHCLGTSDYATVYAGQRNFTGSRDATTADQLWCLEHPSVYTLGLAGKSEHLLNPGSIPVHRTDRGGQVTYHGPGQLVMYPLLDLRRKGISIRNYVNLLEQSIIKVLDQYGITAVRRPGAPGVYVKNRKIAALGIRVRNGCCYHGLALNVDMDLAPFAGINPCGYAGLEVTQLADFGIALSVEQVCQDMVPAIASELGFDGIQNIHTSSNDDLTASDSRVA
jgi:lipoyl(octanoyl) transferase